ncbi:MAG: hypothetical protein RJS97_00635 [Parvibaculaceae bacterium]
MTLTAGAALWPGLSGFLVPDQKPECRTGVDVAERPGRLQTSSPASGRGTSVRSLRSLVDIRQQFADTVHCPPPASVRNQMQNVNRNTL